MSKQRHSQPTEAEFVQEIESRSVNIPNCKVLHKAVIKTGPQTYKLACVLEFVDPDTGKTTHRELRLNDYPFRVSGGIDFSVKERLARWTCRDDEIRKLRVFLESFEGISEAGTHKVVPAGMATAFNEFIDKLGQADLETPQLMDLIAALAEHSTDIRKLPELGEQSKLRMVAAAIRVAHRQAALARFVELIEAGALEKEFQKLLDQNWWMLGGQYIEHVERRQWTTDETIDIMLRTADNYFEIIEIKRTIPLLFKEDHGKQIVSAEINDAVNQAAHYIAEIERTRPAIFQRYHVDLYKLKAKVLIGCIHDEEPDVELKREALRMYNSHLHRIEVITYDQLIRTAENVISANAGESGQEAQSTDSDIAF